MLESCLQSYLACNYAGYRARKASFLSMDVGPSSFLVWPEMGARLMHWSLNLADGQARNIIYWPDNADYTNPRKIRGGNPILFPFTVFTYDKGIPEKWRYNKKQLPMRKHGFALDGSFSIKDMHEHGFTAEFEPTEEDRVAYPFDYVFQVTYRFETLAMHVDLSLENKGRDPVPWSAGHHFYFQVPWSNEHERGHYQFNAPTKHGYYREEDGGLRPVSKFPLPTSLTDDALIDRMHYKLKEPKAELKTLNGEEGITLTMGGNPAPGIWTTVNTWTESEDSPFYCVEPWMSPTNAVEHEKGLQWVEPGEKQIFSVSVDLA